LPESYFSSLFVTSTSPMDFDVDCLYHSRKFFVLF
jgi:hypothetical protein